MKEKQRHDDAVGRFTVSTGKIRSTLVKVWSLATNPGESTPHGKYFGAGARNRGASKSVALTNASLSVVKEQ